MNVSRIAVCLVPALAISLITLCPTRGTTSEPMNNPRDVADLLDQYVQPRFLDDAGKIFGMDRVIHPVEGHRPVFSVSVALLDEIRWLENPTEKKIIAAVKATKYGYFVGFLHVAHTPGKATDRQWTNEDQLRLDMNKSEMSLSPLKVDSRVRFPVIYDLKFKPSRDWRLAQKKPSSLTADETLLLKAERETTPLMRRWEKTAIAATPKLIRGQSIEVPQGEWTLFLRPVKAAKASCVSCHAGAKRGDTLGVMLYAVTNAPRKALKSPSVQAGR